MSKLGKGIRGRIGLSQRLLSIDTALPLYWFQVASSGEFEQCLPILEELKSKANVFVLLTYFSPSAEKAIGLEKERRQRANKELPWDHADYSPIDLPWIVSPLIKHLKPKAYISIHREIWPCLLKHLKARGTKTYLFSTYWPERSRKNIGLLKRWLQLFDFIGTVDEASKTFLLGCCPGKEIEVLGDARVDRVVARQKLSPNKDIWGTFLPGQIFVGASLWAEDFKAIKECLPPPKDWRLILVPHDPNSPTGDQIFQTFKALNLPIRYWSSWIESPDNESHLIVNRVGFLAELYKIASLVFVGGSFKSRVHNVLEPAVYGCPILTGPYVWNSNEAVEMGRDRQGLVICKDAEAFQKEFKSLTADPQKRAVLSKASFDYIEKHKGASRSYSKILEV